MRQQKQLLRNRPFRPSKLGSQSSIRRPTIGGGGSGLGGGVFTSASAYSLTAQTLGGVGTFTGTFNWNSNGAVEIQKTFVTAPNGGILSNLAYTEADLGAFNDNNPRIINFILDVDKTNLTSGNNQSNLVIAVWVANQPYASAFGSPDEGYIGGVVISPVYGGVPNDGSAQRRGVSALSSGGLSFLTASQANQNWNSMTVDVPLIGGRLRSFNIQMKIDDPLNGTAYARTGNFILESSQPQTPLAGNIYAGVVFGTQDGADGFTYNFTYQLRHTIVSF